jgi:predicted GNAT family acetyltransferase
MARARGGIQAVDVDLREAAALCALDPVASVLAAARIESAIRSGAVRSGSTVWGFERDGRLAAVCWAGANVVPVCHPDDDDALDAFAAAAQRQGRRCSSIVGAAGAVLGMWQRLESAWGPARDVRPDQPSFVIDSEPWVMPDAAVRVARPDELDLLLPASIQMFVEEVGYSPTVAGPGAYESRVRTLLEEGRTFVRIEEGPAGPEVIFKADLGAVSRQVAQVQGVWVTPRLRGRRISEHGMAAVVQQTVGRVAPVASLYVNSYNAPAMASYRRVGFREVGRYATVLF